MNAPDDCPMPLSAVPTPNIAVSERRNDTTNGEPSVMDTLLQHSAGAVIDIRMSQKPGSVAREGIV